MEKKQLFEIRNLLVSASDLLFKNYDSLDSEELKLFCDIILCREKATDIYYGKSKNNSNLG